MRAEGSGVLVVFILLGGSDCLSVGLESKVVHIVEQNPL